MITPRDFEFKRWKSGTEYENWVADLLTELQFKANRVRLRHLCSGCYTQIIFRQIILLMY